jgi:hypothetical protein
MSKKLEALKIKAEKELAEEAEAKLNSKMSEIALREQRAKEAEEQRKKDEAAEKKRKETAKSMDKHRKANAAMTQTIQILSSYEMSNTERGQAFIKARDEFNQAMIKAGVGVPALNALK